MTAPIRVLELRSTYGAGGGPDKTILLSAARHDPARVQVRCVYLRGASDPDWRIASRALALGVSYTELLERSRLDPEMLRGLRAEMHRFRPHIVHAHDYKTNVLALLFSPLFPQTRLLSTAHGWTLDNAAMQRYTLLDQASLAYFDHVLAVSKDTRHRLLEAGVSEARLGLLYNGISLEDWPVGDRTQAARSLATQLGLPAEARVVGVIGRLSPEKDLPTAVEVLERVLALRPEVHGVLIGEGAGRSWLKDRVALSPLAQRLHVLGAMPVGPELYLGLAAYLMTSLTEGLPNTLLEAMATATPAVATGVGGIPELVGDSDAVLLYPPRDVLGLSQGLERILAMPDEAHMRGQRARSRIEADFSFAARLERITSVYEALGNETPWNGTPITVPPVGVAARMLRLIQAGSRVARRLRVG